MITWGWVHQFEGNVGDQFTAHGAQVEFDAGHVRNDETGGLGAFGNGSRRRQIHLIVLFEPKGIDDS